MSRAQFSSKPNWIPTSMIPHLPEPLEPQIFKSKIPRAAAHENPVSAVSNSIFRHNTARNVTLGDIPSSTFQGPSKFAPTTFEYHEVNYSVPPQSTVDLAGSSGQVKGSTTIRNADSLASRKAIKLMNNREGNNFILSNDAKVQEFLRKKQKVQAAKDKAERKAEARRARGLHSQSFEAVEQVAPVLVAQNSRSGNTTKKDKNTFHKRSFEKKNAKDQDYTYEYSYYSEDAVKSSPALVKARSGKRLSSSISSSEPKKEDQKTKAGAVDAAECHKCAKKPIKYRGKGQDSTNSSAWGSIPPHEQYRNERKSSREILPDWDHPHKAGNKIIAKESRAKCC